ncbi:MAG: CZB domain-containing protein [Spirochaetia bacterium]|nr:CZB domain-containing protein [Spirochaetia bacterium]
MLDFTIAKMKHQMWKRKLHHYIFDNSPIDEKEMVSERDCQLGKWLYAEGMEKYKSLLEINTLERVHKNLHALTHSIVDDKKNNKIDAAKAGLDELSGISDEIVGLLDTLELKIKNSEF